MNRDFLIWKNHPYLTLSCPRPACIRIGLLITEFLTKSRALLVALAAEFFLLFSLIQAHAAEDPFSDIRQLILSNDSTVAIVKLKSITSGEFSIADKALAHLSLGILHQKKHEYAEAEAAFENSLKLGTKLPEYVHLLLARQYRELGNLKKAYMHLTQIRSRSGSRENYHQARFELALIAIQEKNWRNARHHLRYVSRRMRSTELYPEILYQLVRSEIMLRSSWRACRWARSLFSRYPTHKNVNHWGIDLQSVDVDGKKLGCIATISDLKRRILNLQWAGASDRARTELDILRARTTPRTRYHVDTLLTEFLAREGFVDEALNLLIPYYREKNHNFSYLMLLGRIAAKAQKFQTAVGAYYNAYKLNQRSGSGRKALFRAAFLSYQFQDYDGAGRKFSLLVKRFPNSGLIRDAHWHLAWIRYLKGDYPGAYHSFSKILQKMNRRARYWRSVPKEKVQYWIAMSLLKMGDSILAKTQLNELAQKPNFGYYSILARYRLKDFTSHPAERGLASESKDFEPLPEKREFTENAESQVKEKRPELETEEEVSKDEKEDVAVEREDLEPIEAGDEEDVFAKLNFSSPQIMRRFARAQDLMRIGLFDWAKWELFEIEGRTRKSENLKMLISQYELISSFHRSTYVSQVLLGNERVSGGVDGAKELWEATFPLAYRKHIMEVAERFGVPNKFVWSIIRAESQYRTDAISPTGARGLMQIMPHTAWQVSKLLKDSEFVTNTLKQPEVNIRIGTRYLHRLLKKFSGRLPLAAAAYNAGPHRVDAWLTSFGRLEMDEFIEHIPFIETRNYVKKVMRNFQIYNTIYENESWPMAWMVLPVGVKSDGSSPFRENWDPISEAAAAKN